MIKMNIQQKNYARAKALVDTLEAQVNKIERDYINGHDIVNQDKTVPEHVWCIDDEATFNKANEETAPAVDALGIYEARQILHGAEDELIQFGLSIIPAKQRQILGDCCFGRNGNYVHIDVRQQVIDLAFKLDVSPIKAGAV